MRLAINYLSSKVTSLEFGYDKEKPRTEIFIYEETK